MYETQEAVSLSNLNEAISLYVKKSKLSSAKVNNLQDFLSNKLLIIHTIKSGVSFKLFEQVKELTPFSDQDWATYLDISLKTLKRNESKKAFRFKPIHSEKIIELAELSHYGLEVFSSLDAFNHWLRTPLQALGGMLPLDLISNSYGQDMLMAELNRIEHGLFA